MKVINVVRKSGNNKLKKEKGITLIALVITIIVLLILAGITVATLTGENGLLSKANSAAENTKIANAKEKLETELLSIQAEKLAKGEEINISALDENKNQLKSIGIEIEETGVPRNVTVDGYVFKVNNNLSIGDEIEIGKVDDETGRGDPVNTSDKKDLWTNWLTEAGVNVSSYSSTQILNNESLLSTLMNNKKAVDYMKDSTEFIVPAIANSETAMNQVANSTYLKDIIKSSAVTSILHNSKYSNKIDSKMTKNYTMSSGENENAKVEESSYSEDSTKGWKAFDGTATWRYSWISGSTEAITQTVHPTLTYQYKKESIVPYKFSIVGNTDGGLTGKAYIEASNDGNTYKTITDSFDIPADTTTTVYPNQNISDYSYFRIVITKETSNSGYNRIVFSECEIYGIKEKDLQ